MITAREVGEERIRRVLDFEREQYVRGRSAARGEEPPLSKAEREEYVYYHRGALAMWELREAFGEPQINRALASLVANAAGGGAYPTTQSLLTALRAVAPDDARPRVARLFDENR